MNFTTCRIGRSRYREQAFAGVLAAVGALPAIAHDLWVDGEATIHVLRYGHERSQHEGERQLAYAPDFVKQARCFGRDGREAKASLSAGYPAKLAGTCAATIFSASSGFWTKTPYGTKNEPKGSAAQVLESWQSFDMVKTLREWSPAFARPLTQELEITPLENPLLLKAGDKLSVRVTWRGQPRAGVAVAYHGNPRGTTGADGTVNIRLRDPGFQLIQASVDEPVAAADAGKADKAVFATHLGFTLP